MQVGNVTWYTFRPFSQSELHSRAYVDDGGSGVSLVAIENAASAAGWTLGHIVGISDDGKVIAGNGTHDGHAEAWVAHLP